MASTFTSNKQPPKVEEDAPVTRVPKRDTGVETCQGGQLLSVTLRFLQQSLGQSKYSGGNELR